MLDSAKRCSCLDSRTGRIRHGKYPAGCAVGDGTRRRCPYRLRNGALKVPASAPDCPEASRRPYTVISSLPVEVAAAGGEGTIPPRVVFRVIQGYKYFGSYGITNVVGGADNQACELRNTVRGPAGKGDWSFGDLVTLKAFAPAELVAPAKAFDTLGQAAKYANESADFANVQRMLMSLKIKN